MKTPLVEFRSVCKTYYMGEDVVRAADNISFKIFENEFVAIVGKSGSGKSTCMNIIGCLDVPTSGQYLLDGKDVGLMDKNELAEIRNEKLGFIFQQYNLLPKSSIYLFSSSSTCSLYLPRACNTQKSSASNSTVTYGIFLSLRINTIIERLFITRR